MSIDDWSEGTWFGVVVITILLCVTALLLTCILTEPTDCHSWSESWRHTTRDSEQVKLRYERCMAERNQTTSEAESSK